MIAKPMADLFAGVLPELEASSDPTDVRQAETLALMRRFVSLCERSAALAVEQQAVTAEIEQIGDRLRRLTAGAAMASDNALTSH